MNDDTVLFPFDNVSVPFRNGLQLHLEQARKHEDNPVLPLGSQGAPGAERGASRSRTLHVCYATSDDGIHWRKPAPGLVPSAARLRGPRQPAHPHDRLDAFDRPLRLQVTHGGLRIEDARVYALYVAEE